MAENHYAWSNAWNRPSLQFTDVSMCEARCEVPSAKAVGFLNSEGSKQVASPGVRTATSLKLPRYVVMNLECVYGDHIHSIQGI
jgi:hypothetical protein